MHESRPHEHCGAKGRFPIDISLHTGKTVRGQTRSYSELNQSVTAMIGSEMGSQNFGHALEYLNHELNLGLDAVDLTVFGMLLTSLSKANRFGGDLHICPILGENSAAHTLRTMILDAEISARANALEEQSQHSDSSSQQRIQRLRSILTHDMGELPGEMTSLAGRTRNAALQEMPEIEREIFRIHLTEAYRMALATPLGYPEYYRFQSEIRRAVDGGQASSEQDQKAMVRTLEQIVSAYDRNNPVDGLPARIRDRIKEWMVDFDTIEVKDATLDRERMFIGYAAKISEHLQGTRHLLRFGTIHRDDTRLNLLFPNSHANAPRDPLDKSEPDAMIPLRYLSNMRMIQGLRYQESDLCGLFSYASTEQDFRHARELRNAVFLTVIEWLSVARPVFDRGIAMRERHLQGEDPRLIELQEVLRLCRSEAERKSAMQATEEFLKERLAEDVRRAQEHRTSLTWETDKDELLEIETRYRMQALYRHAIANDYIPKTSTPLLLLENVPQHLRGFARSVESIS